MKTDATAETQLLVQKASGGQADDQFRLAQHYLNLGLHGQARRWLNRAARQHHIAALLSLAELYIYGHGISPDLNEARTCLGSAARLGSGEAHFRLASLNYDIDPELATKHLADAASAGHARAWFCYAVGHKLNQDETFSIACLRRSADLGHELSAALLGLDCESGDSDKSDSIDRSYSAAALADSLVIESRATGDKAIPTDEQLLTPFQDLMGTVPVAISASDSQVDVCDTFLSAAECYYLIDLVAEFMMPSYTIDPETGKRVLNPVRTSDGWSVHPNQEDFLVKWMKSRIAQSCGLEESSFEPLSILRYRSGQQYYPHYDFINPVSEADRIEIASRGQRVQTVIVYLNEPEDGGATSFPKLDILLEARQGRLIRFSNVMPDGSVDRNSQHAGCPVNAGEKWIVALWSRGHTNKQT